MFRFARALSRLSLSLNRLLVLSLFVVLLFALWSLLLLDWFGAWHADRAEEQRASAPGGAMVLPMGPVAALGSSARAFNQSPGREEEVCVDLIVNGGFEALGGWVLPIAERPAAYTDARAASGQRSLLLGLEAEDPNTAGDSRVMQTLLLPAEATEIYLTAQLWREVSDPDGRDRFEIALEGADGAAVLLEFTEASEGWTTISADLSRYAGETGRLHFAVTNDGAGGRAAMYVDDVRVVSCRPLFDQPQPTLEPGIEPTPSPSPSGGPAQGTEAHILFAPRLAQLPPPTSDSIFEDPMMPDRPTRTPTSVPTPAPSHTPAPTAIPAPVCQELLANGSFETDAGWTIPQTGSPGRYTTERFFDGARSVGLGIPPGGAHFLTDSTIYRRVTLPNEAASIILRAWVWRQGNPGERDFHYLWLTANGQTERVMQGLSNQQAWELIEIDMASYLGKQVLLLFGTYNTGVGQRASMYVDAVSLQLCDAAPAPSPMPDGTATPVPTPDYAPAPSLASPAFGVNTFLWWRPEVADRDLDLVNEAGFGWVRQSFAWEDIEGEDNAYTWRRADRVVQQINASGLNLVARLGMDPDLADFWAGHPPQNIDDFADFAGVLARRYNCTSQAVGCIQAYQIWNEANLAREWGGNRPSPTAYARMLARSYAAIKAANPNAIVISGGMAPTGTDNAIAMPDVRFYRELYQAMGGDSEGYFDLLGVHAAGFAAPPETDPSEAASTPGYGNARFFAFRHAEDIREIMVAYGDSDTRIAILEFGWTSDPYNADYAWFGAGAGIDEFVKADYLVRAYRYAEENWQPWIAIMSVLTMPNLDWLADGDPFDEEQYWWAIMEPSQVDELRLRPAYVALCGYLNEKRGAVCPYLPD